MKQLKRIYILSTFLVLSGCISNTAIESPSQDNYFHIINTPIYVLKAENVNQLSFDEDLSKCILSSKDKANLTNKLGTGVGATIVANGLYVIATAGGGFFGPLAVLGGSMVVLAGGGAIWATQATGKYREYSNIEICLENQGYDVVFYGNA
jgi:hypothetical protein|tara:strand:- start:2618 stop:3070 length:453 start_codon:yes stop_codon:yes gene_type:complete